MSIDLTRIPAPDLVEVLAFESIYADKLAAFQAVYPDYTAALESDPVVKLLELSAYDELMLRARINDAARASMLAYACGNDLDHRAADYGVQRSLLIPKQPDAYPPIEAVWEDDERLRLRCQMALEQATVAGSRGAYLFHALSASAQIADVSIDAPTFSLATMTDAVSKKLPAGALVLVCQYAAGIDNPLPGDVAVTLLPRPGVEDAAALLTLAEHALSADEIRPLTDRPRIGLGKPKPFRVVATITMEAGPDSDVVMGHARQRLDALLAESRKLGRELPLSALYAALHVPGVRSVYLEEPQAPIVCDLREYPECTGIVLSKGKV
ncbi:baseplate assembly protein [Chitinimonas sp. PSY-7]|uniref:baseplate J/gp47 family protein n=1 Tax=Chitinimonas sp. PSY-7 TaxID=3459088 RepID=UPI0040401A3A